jgi:hypothetical protein
MLLFKSDTKMKKMILIALILFLILGGVYALVNWWTMRGVKTPSYTVLSKDGAFETRRYAPMLIATVTVSGARDHSISQGFRQLAAYIFGDNQSAGKKIAMTSPVMQAPAEKLAMTSPVIQQGADNQWQVQFVMPSSYRLSTLPKPNNPNIHLREIKAHTALAFRFSGRASNARLHRFEQRFIKYVRAHQFNLSSPVRYAFYNPPWTLPFFRRNEIIATLSD